MARRLWLIKKGIVKKNKEKCQEKGRRYYEKKKESTKNKTWFVIDTRELREEKEIKKESIVEIEIGKKQYGKKYRQNMSEGDNQKK